VAINETIDSIIQEENQNQIVGTPNGVSEQIRKAKRLERKIKKAQARKEKE